MLLELHALEDGLRSPLAERVVCARWAALGARPPARLHDPDPAARERPRALALNSTGQLLLAAGSAAPSQVGGAPRPQAYVAAYSVPEGDGYVKVATSGRYGGGGGENENTPDPLAMASVADEYADGGTAALQWVPGDSSVFVAAAREGVVSVWDAAAFEPVARCEVLGRDAAGRDSLASLDLSSAPGGCPALVAVAGTESDVRLIDVRCNAVVQDLAGHDGAVTDVAWSPTDGNLLASGGVDGSVRLFDVRRAGTAAGLCVFDMCNILGSDRTAEAVARGRRRALAAARGRSGGHAKKRRRSDLLGLGMAWERSDGTGKFARRKRLERRDQTTGRCGQLRAHDSGVRRVRFAPDGHALVTGGGDGYVRVWDTLSAHCLMSQFSGMTAYGSQLFNVSGDGSILFAQTYDCVLESFDMATGAPLTRLDDGSRMPKRVQDFVVHPVREELVVAYALGDIGRYVPALVA